MFLYILILAVVQGVCEFLPISSSGHLVLLNTFFGIKSDFLLISIVLHLATLFSSLFVLKNDIKEFFINPFGKKTKSLLLATIATVIIVFFFKSYFTGAFDGKYLPFCFMITAFVIFVSEQVSKRKKNNPIGYRSSLIMGIMQAIAVLPGISRSGFTICGGISMGNNKEEVCRFSFLMSMPIIIASVILEVYDYITLGETLTFYWYELLIGFIVAFIVGVISCKFMLRIVRKHFAWFSLYLIAISIISFFVIY